MKQGEIIETIIAYFTKQPENHIGALGGKHYFHVTGVKEEDEKQTYLFVYGHAVDIVADLLDNNRFFPPNVSGSSNVGNPGCAKIHRLSNKSELSYLEGTYKVEVMNDHLSIEHATCSEREYTKVLKEPASFMNAAAILDIDDLEKKVNLLFSKED